MFRLIQIHPFKQQFCHFVPNYRVYEEKFSYTLAPIDIGKCCCLGPYMTRKIYESGFNLVIISEWVGYLMVFERYKSRSKALFPLIVHTELLRREHHIFSEFPCCKKSHFLVGRVFATIRIAVISNASIFFLLSHIECIFRKYLQGATIKIPSIMFF